MGIDPYPAEMVKVTHTAKDILDGFEKDEASYQEVLVSGRLVSIRVMGKASFAVLQDSTAKLQLYISRDDISTDEAKTEYNTIFKKLIDMGDFVAVKGFVFKTGTGEISVHAKELTLLTKSLKPLPVVKTSKDEDGNETVHDAFTDPEQRYRQRYVDLVVNPHVRETFIQRTKLMNSMREFLNSHGYLEVETPILQAIPGGASARPFITHHNALDIPLYLRIANELYLKRLIIGGFEAVYEFAKDFRNEGMDRTHNPEFTQMEIYVSYKDYHWMMDFTEEMIEKIALDLHGQTEVQVGERTINFQRPYKRVTMYGAILEHTGIDISEMDEVQLRQTCQDLGIHTDDSMGKGKLIDEIFGEKCEGNYIQPTFITDYPKEMSPLCKKHRDNPELTERFELMVNGKEVANAYSELNDPIDQRERFEEQMRLSQKGDDEAMFIDQDFLRALEYGMPPTSGMGIGIDRLMMMMTNQPSIQDVLFFPQMRPEKQPVYATEQDYLAIGVRAELIPIIQKLGLHTIEQLQSQELNKLHNDVCATRKKMKLKEVQNPSKDEVQGWLDAEGVGA